MRSSTFTLFLSNRSRYHFSLDSTKYDINLLNTCNYCNINQWPDLAQFADYLHMSVNNNENLKSLYSLFTHSDDSQHISFTAYLLCALFLAREDEESILDFLRVVSKVSWMCDNDIDLFCTKIMSLFNFLAVPRCGRISYKRRFSKCSAALWKTFERSQRSAY